MAVYSLYEVACRRCVNSCRSTGYVHTRVNLFPRRYVSLYAHKGKPYRILYYDDGRPAQPKPAPKEEEKPRDAESILKAIKAKKQSEATIVAAAADAFLSGLGTLEAARRALAASAVCASDGAAVNPRLSREAVDLKVSGMI